WTWSKNPGRVHSPPSETGAFHTMSAAENPLVRFEGVTKHYGNADGHPALDRLDLSIARGEIIGIIGESGAGKSTLLQLINGLTCPTSGAGAVDGRLVDRLSRRGLRELHRDIGVVFQGIHLLSNRTASSNGSLALQLARRRLNAGARTRTSRTEIRQAT